MRSAVLIAFIIATALFMENMGGTVISTLLPAIALDLHQDPIVADLRVPARGLPPKDPPIQACIGESFFAADKK